VSANDHGSPNTVAAYRDRMAPGDALFSCAANRQTRTCRGTLPISTRAHRGLLDTSRDRTPQQRPAPRNELVQTPIRGLRYAARATPSTQRSSHAWSPSPPSAASGPRSHLAEGRGPTTLVARPRFATLDGRASDQALLEGHYRNRLRVSELTRFTQPGTASWAPGAHITLPCTGRTRKQRSTAVVKRALSDSWGRDARTAKASPADPPPTAEAPRSPGRRWGGS